MGWKMKNLVSYPSIKNPTFPGIITMGKERNHLKFKAISNIYKDTDPVEIVGFDMAEFYIDRLDLRTS